MASSVASVCEAIASPRCTRASATACWSACAAASKSRAKLQVVPLQLPALEEADLLTNPVDELKRVEELLQDQPTP